MSRILVNVIVVQFILKIIVDDPRSSCLPEILKVYSVCVTVVLSTIYRFMYIYYPSRNTLGEPSG